MHIGLKIKELAEKKNLTLANLAKSIGKTKQAVYEMVEKEDVNTQILKQLSTIYNVPIEYFFGVSEENHDDYKEKLTQLEKENSMLRDELNRLQKGKSLPTKVVVEFDVTPDEFIKMGLKDKIVQVLDKK